jgi:3-hydroxyisobutyrate dehydrogenase-like beta-hydroxyacid dehydrogenase
MKTTVGILGLGPMGGIIATNLRNSNFTILGYDIRAECRRELEVNGGTSLSSTTEVADRADVLITSLPGALALDTVVDDVLKSDRPDHVVIETSTLTLDQKLEAAKRLALAGKSLLDCPISGTPSMLANMTASIYVSGDKERYEQCLPVFEGFAAISFFVGPVGNGTRMKLLANYLVHVHTTAAAECIVMGEKAGLAPDLIYQALKPGAGGSKMFEVRGAMMAKSDYREGGGTMFEIFKKDSAIITEFAASIGAPIDLYTVAREKLNSAIELGFGHLDTSVVCRAVEMAAGIDRQMVE